MEHARRQLHARQVGRPAAGGGQQVGHALERHCCDDKIMIRVSFFFINKQ